MQFSRDEILDIMNNKNYPLSLKYDPDWILENSIGSHSLWLTESLGKVMEPKPGSRVLDLGCGKAITSIFLAKEYQVKVWATDLYIDATENWHRICAMGQQDNVCPIHADASNLPFAEKYFDYLVSINSLFFFVTDSEYLKNHLLNLVKPGGIIGIIVPGFLKDYENDLPDAYEPYARTYGLDKWHTATWWKKLFEETNMVDILVADAFENEEGIALLQKSEQIRNAHEEPFTKLAWNDMSYYRIIARRK